jgi:hypothetical protein
MDWGLVLGAIGVIGIPAAVGLTMAAATPGEFRFVWGCFIVAATLTLGSFIWLTYEQPLGLAKILVAGIIGAIVSIGLVIAFGWVRSKQDAAEHAASPVATEEPAAPLAKVPQLRLTVFGGNIFTPNASDVRSRLTGMGLTVQIWNTGSPSVATEWSLVVTPQGKGPVVAQLTKIPEQLIATGKINSSVLRSSDDLSVIAASREIRSIPINGTLLFYVALDQATVLNPTTQIRLAVRDIYTESRPY